MLDNAFRASLKVLRFSADVAMVNGKCSTTISNLRTRIAILLITIARESFGTTIINDNSTDSVKLRGLQGKCCVWDKFSSTTTYSLIFSAPSVPPTASCDYPYYWDSCSNTSNCVTITCAANVYGFDVQGNIASCVYNLATALELLAVNGIQGTCTQSEGVSVQEGDTTSSDSLDHVDLNTSVSSQAIATDPTDALSGGNSSVDATIAFVESIGPGKQRSWLGAGLVYLEGVAPSARYGHGLAAHGGNLYVFGGHGQNGECMPQSVQILYQKRFSSS